MCAKSAFGLLCPQNKREELDRAVNQAQALVDEFNSTASLTRVKMNVMVGYIASDDVEAVQKINGEVRELLSAMEQGIANLDVAAVRKAISAVKSVGDMLSPEAAARVQMAIDVARKSART